MTAKDEWRSLPWKAFQVEVSKLQTRIFRASRRGDVRAVRKLQRLLMSSQAARHVAVRRVTQDNRGRKTAGVDGKTALRPAERLHLVRTLRLGDKARPVRRGWVPQPGKAEKRPLGIPTIRDRAAQALAKLALEPEWEARFEPNSYGFRPGRSVHDAVSAVAHAMAKPKYVLDADIASCFDRIDHEALLAKINTAPRLRRVIQQWLTAGARDGQRFFPTDQGTPQGGVLTPPTIWQTPLFRARYKRVRWHAKDDTDLRLVDLNARHDRADQLPAGIPIGGIELVGALAGELFQATDQQPEILV